MKRHLEQFRPDDTVDYAISYFKKVQSCTHIVGTTYNYVLESIHNRKALIYCLTESFKGFDDQSEISPNEIYHFIESISPGFPKSVVLEAAMLVVSNINHIATLVDIKCSFELLFRNISCFILYDEWLKLIEEAFRSDGKGMFLSIARLKLKLEEFYQVLPLSIYQPPWTAIQTVLEISAQNEKDLSFDHFKKRLFQNPAVAMELEAIAQYPNSC